jgi:tRNA-uridine 2-sulfurtransferase
MNFSETVNLFKEKVKDPSEVKIGIALSGGVDSSVCAALLKRAGFKVKAFFLDLYDSDFFNDSFSGAKEISKKLEIPFFRIDARKEFKKEVINYFLSELKKGRTPNPCVVCNEKIKARLLIKEILNQGMDFLATGHYVKKEKEDLFKILRGEDKTRDQSYFLWKLSQRMLSKLLFPLGHLKKEDVLKEAKKEGLLNRRKESREICFIEDNFESFTSQFLEIRKGPIVNKKGKYLGEHKGLPFYTIGQRKRIGLSGGPYYVLEKNLEDNSLIITKNKKDLLRKKIFCSQLNWISGKKPSFPLKVKIKTRYTQDLFPATLKGTEVVFGKKQKVIAPGQSAVFYTPFKKDWEMIGGGVIEGSV